MFVLKTGLYSNVGFIFCGVGVLCCEHTKDRVHFPLPRPTLATVKGKTWSMATKCWLKQRTRTKQLSSIWQNLKSDFIN